MGDAAETATASNVTVSADEKTVTVDVIAKDAATNGLFNVDYDAANLTLTNVSFNTQYSSHKDASKVTLGYVDLNGVTAGSTVATLTFTVNDPTALDKINVTVTETQRNDQTVNNAETLAADLHTETETVNAKAATCTEDGYTGDVVCKACGKVITKGEVIPCLGHKIELVGAKAATCTEDGYTGDEVCTVCGEIVKKGEVIPALGHKIAGWVLATPASPPAPRTATTPATKSAPSAARLCGEEGRGHQGHRPSVQGWQVHRLRRR